MSLNDKSFQSSLSYVGKWNCKYLNNRKRDRKKVEKYCCEIYIYMINFQPIIRYSMIKIYIAKFKCLFKLWFSGKHNFVILNFSHFKL